MSIKRRMVTLVSVLLVSGGLQADEPKEFRVSINGLYQIPVQAALALEDIKYELFYNKDWHAESLEVMQETLEITRIGVEMHRQEQQALSFTEQEKPFIANRHSVLPVASLVE